MSNYMIFSGTANPELAKDISKYLDSPIARYYK
jgi:phosphoribosylpyrophosphate synthetase